MDTEQTVKELESLQRNISRIEFSQLDSEVIEAAIKAREAMDILLQIMRDNC